MPHDLTWVVSGCFCMFLPVFVKLIFLNIVFVCFCGAYFLMVSFNASLFASPPSSMSDFTCWFKREPGTIYLFVYTKNHCSVYLCVEARIYWTLNRFASVQFSKIDTSLKVLKFGSKVGSQSNAACTDRSTRSKRQGTGIICLVFTCFTTFSMHQDDPEHKHKIRHSSHLSNQRCPTGHRGGNCLWMVKFLLLLRKEVPLCLCRQAAIACTHCFELDDLWDAVASWMGFCHFAIAIWFVVSCLKFCTRNRKQDKSKWYVGRKVCFFHFLCLFSLRFNWFLTMCCSRTVE